MDNKAYRFNDKGEYVGEQTAQLDPLATKLKGKNVYLCPAGCTFVKPTIEAGKKPVYDTNLKIWHNITDNRGKKYYDFETKSVQEVKELGEDCVILSENEIQEINTGKTVELKNGKYKIYWTKDQKKENVRQVRNRYLDATDKFLSIIDYPINDELREKYREYRIYLRDYTKGLLWYNKEPLTFDDWNK